MDRPVVAHRAAVDMVTRIGLPPGVGVVLVGHPLLKLAWAPLAAALILALPGFCRAGQVITLEQALNISLKRSPVLVASKSTLESSRGQLTQAESAYWPQISASAGYNRTYQDTNNAKVNLETWDNGYNASGSFSQYLYDFGRTGGLVSQSRHRLTSSRQGLYDTLSQLAMDVKVAYFTVLENQHLLAVSQEYLDSQQRHLELARALYKQGMRPKIDVLTGETKVSRARLVLVQAKYALRKSKVGMEKLLGGPPVKGEYSLSEAGPMPKTPAELPPLVQKTLANRPSVAQAQASVMASKALLESVQGSYWPSLRAKGSYGHSDNEFPLDANGLVGVELNWDLFTGFSRSGRVSEVRADTRRLQALLDNHKLTVVEEVTQAYLALREALESIKTARIGVKQAQENLDMARGRYQAGESNAIEFNDAQISYTEAKSLLVQATYGYFKAWAGLEYAVGGDQAWMNTASGQLLSKASTAGD